MRTQLTIQDNIIIDDILSEADMSDTNLRYEIVKLADKIHEESDVPLVDAYQIALNRKLR
jgi:hypothetical protein